MAFFNNFKPVALKGSENYERWAIKTRALLVKEGLKKALNSLVSFGLT